MSQCAQSLLVGLPQGHLSKIESGLVDLQLSSLIELTCALDLEVTLVHRSLAQRVVMLQTEKCKKKHRFLRPLHSFEDIDEE